jgi:hypothetical protein
VGWSFLKSVENLVDSGVAGFFAHPFFSNLAVLHEDRGTFNRLYVRKLQSQVQTVSKTKLSRGGSPRSVALLHIPEMRRVGVKAVWEPLRA